MEISKQSVNNHAKHVELLIVMGYVVNKFYEIKNAYIRTYIIHTYIQTYTHTYIHTYIYTHHYTVDTHI